ncbi:uncharacterized protein LOC132552330 [Ylistrum balloti]|uniref:uncharacterized protein LOC132552330 n=1 Tax=Ylistrum balloti TaxID=509963 RepID=UPI0029057E79|nr:uncharacterized protein LOC132552330 [Ylistrum balloti]
MNRKLYTALVGKVVRDPIVRSGMKLASRVNLFQALREKPMTVRTLASELNMKERYIWELSQAMMASGVITMDAKEQLAIPPDCVDILLAETEKAAWNPHLFKTLPILDSCFPLDGKPGYTLDEAPFVLDLLNEVRSPYRASLVTELVSNINLLHLDSGNLKNVLDVGCGSGDITIPQAEQMQGINGVGCDTSEKAIVTASKSTKVKNVSFTHVDSGAYQRDWIQKMDVILMFDVLHDLPHPQETMTEIKKVLKDDGIMIIIDPDVSNNPQNNIGNLHAANALTFSSFYCVPSSCCHAHSSALGISWGREGK